MRRARLPCCLVLAALASAPAAAQSPFDLTEVAWTLEAEPTGQTLRLEMRLAPLHQRERVMLRMPLWKPGSYNYANFQRQLSGLVVTDQDGKERALTACDERSWQVDARGAIALTARYQISTENVADEGAMPALMRNGPATFLYAEGALELPHTLEFRLPAEWDHASGHREHPLRPGTYYSPNFDVFVDCPIVVGGLERYTFTLHDRPFEVVLYGKLPTEAQFSRAGWVEKVRKISDASFELVKDFPFERYVYLFGFTDVGGGYGLEHLNSTTIEFNHGAIKGGSIEGLESVTAHEFFHLWNVKRIRPEALGPFDYASDVRTKDLWWMEGVTSYYNDVLLQRSGLRTGRENWFLEEQARNGRNLQAATGYGKLSPERASWTIWDGTGRQISYYDQGQALGLLLDVQIRHHTGNQRSLDDVVRFLHRWVDYPSAGLRAGDLERAVRAISGWDPAEFFERYVAGNRTFPYAEVLALAGVKVLELRVGDAFLGLALDEELALTRDEPVAELRAGDKLVRIANAGVRTTDELQAATAALTPGAVVELVIERKGAGRVKAAWTVKERDRSDLRFWIDLDASESQRAILDGILTGTPEGI